LIHHEQRTGERRTYRGFHRWLGFVFWWQRGALLAGCAEGRRLIIRALGIGMWCEGHHKPSSAAPPSGQLAKVQKVQAMTPFEKKLLHQLEKISDRLRWVGLFLFGIWFILVVGVGK
jgi:hypothetical protein